jgi:hypothetical protein
MLLSPERHNIILKVCDSSESHISKIQPYCATPRCGWTGKVYETHTSLKEMGREIWEHLSETATIYPDKSMSIHAVGFKKII